MDGCNRCPHYQHNEQLRALARALLQHAAALSPDFLVLGADPADILDALSASSLDPALSFAPAAPAPAHAPAHRASDSHSSSAGPPVGVHAEANVSAEDYGYSYEDNDFEEALQAQADDCSFIVEDNEGEFSLAPPAPDQRHLQHFLAYAGHRARLASSLLHEMRSAGTPCGFSVVLVNSKGATGR